MTIGFTTKTEAEYYSSNQLQIKGQDGSQNGFPFTLVLPTGTYDSTGSTFTLSYQQFESGFPFINAINQSTANLTLNPSNTNYVTVLGSTQTKTGGLNILGNVGIGTSSPQRKLDVLSGAGDVLRVGAWSNLSGDTSGGAVVGNNFYRIYNGAANVFRYTNTHGTLGYSGTLYDSGAVSFYNAVGATTKDSDFTPTLSMMINSSGNVGIGTNNPEDLLHVTGSIPKIILQGSNEFLGPQLRFRDSAGSIASPSIPTQPDFYAGALYWDAYNGSAWKGVGAFLVNGDGTPSATSLPTSFNFLTTSPNQVDASVKAQLNSTGDMFVNSINASDTNRLGVGTFSMASGAQFEVSKSTFVVQTAGSVGIGTASPSYRLHISSAYASGSNPEILGITFTPTNYQSYSALKFGYTPDSSWSGSSIRNYFERFGVGYGSGLRFTTSDDSNVAVERMAIDYNGNVGIGTVLPTQKLHIADQTTNGAQALLQSFRSSSGSNSQVVFNKARGTIALPSAVTNGDSLGQYSFSGYDGSAYIPSAAIVASVDGITGTNDIPGRIGFRTTPDGAAATLERMAINNAGNVGIGTVDPASKFQVFENQGSVSGSLFSDTFGHSIRVLAGTCDGCYSGLVKSGDNAIIFTSGTANTGGLAIAQWRGDTALNGIRIDPSGNVGIGTTNPGSIVDIRGSGSQYSNQAKDLTFGNKTYTESIIRSTETTTSFGGSYRADLAFLTNNNNTVSEKMRIQYDGNVGIGNNSPRQKLDVYGSIATHWNDGDYIGMQYLTGSDYKNGMSFNASNRTTNLFAYSGDNSEEITFSLGTVASPSEKMRIATGGNVGIGTTAPYFPLTVAGSGNNDNASTQKYNTTLEVLNLVGSGANNDRTNLITFTDSNSSQGAIGGYRQSWAGHYLGGLMFLVGSQPAGYNQGRPATNDQASKSLTEAMRITPTGNVGIGVAGPGTELQINAVTPELSFSDSSYDGTPYQRIGLSSAASSPSYMFYRSQNATHDGSNWVHVVDGGFGGKAVRDYLYNGTWGVSISTWTSHIVGWNEALYVSNAGNVGIATTSPGEKLQVDGDATKRDGGLSWKIYSDKRLKDIKGNFGAGLKEIESIQPVKFTYKADKEKREQIGLIAQEVRKVIPEAVSEDQKGYLTMHADPVIWAMLNSIKELNEKIKKLEDKKK